MAPNCTNILVEGNEVSGSYETHGIYFNCGGLIDVCGDIVIRRNYIHDNNWSGIQLSAFTIGDLVSAMRNVTVEDNVIEYNARLGPAQITAYSLENSVIRDNTIRADGPSTTGIKFWRQEPGGASTTNNVQVLNNCISIRRAGVGYAMQLSEGSENNRFDGNTFIGAGGWWATILVAPSAFNTITSDNNRFTANDDGSIIRQYDEWGTNLWYSLPDWQAEMGQDMSSQIVQTTDCP